MPGKLEYSFEQNRLQSFDRWHFTDEKPCSALKMAEAGFFKVDEPDTVQCFYCGKQLDGWEADDEPWKEHKSHSSACKFAEIGLSEDSLTLEQLLALQEDLIEQMVKDGFKTFTKDVNNKFALIKKYVSQCKRLGKIVY